ncbi:ABC transporter ATP-binding protein [Sphingobium sp. HBC34]|uniref:ABC transporter ATP-binding protein n=1 Tax=Sphingobium cyanobacteriorum TaxID=3063954 RepID=A0ABT8ZST5_9SPHN|nr:ABC transporter ATP-binding protein [Sphingobium sp. HBC34]MDO7837158.1 ABC transporter ATP-binding protein [Sphingobium sp. HBC34]
MAIRKSRRASVSEKLFSPAPPDMPSFFTGRRRFLFAVLLLLSFAQVAFGVAAADAVSKLFAGLSRAAVLDRFAVATLVGAVLAIGSAEFGRRWTTEALGLDYAHTVRMVLFERLLRRPYRGGRSRSRGNVLLPFVGDLTALRQWWADGVARGTSSTVIAIGLCLYLGWHEPVLALALGGLVLGALCLIAFLAIPYGRATSSQRRERGAMTGLISDRVASAHSVFALGGLQRELRQIDRRIARMNKAALIRARWSGAMRAIAASAHLAGTLVTLLVATVLAGNGAMEIHRVVGSMTLVGLLGGCIGDLVRSCELAIPAHISRQRLETRLNEVKPMLMQRVDSKRRAKTAKAPILSVQGLKTDTGALPFSTIAKAGDIILVDGEAGCGKSTLLAAIAGFQPPFAGLILAIGFAATRLPQKLRREAVGFAGKAAPLLQATLAANLQYRLRPPMDLQDLTDLMKATGLSHYVTADGGIVPLRLNDGGQQLPEAQIQAIQIVRAMAGNPRLLILDDLFDGFDDSALQQVASLLRDHPGVVILVSRRPEIRAIANRVWTLTPSGIEEGPAPALRPASVLPLPSILKA